MTQTEPSAFSFSCYEEEAVYRGLVVPGAGEGPAPPRGVVAALHGETPSLPWTLCIWGR